MRRNNFCLRQYLSAKIKLGSLSKKVVIFYGIIYTLNMHYTVQLYAIFSYLPSWI